MEHFDREYMLLPVPGYSEESEYTRANVNNGRRDVVLSPDKVYTRVETMPECVKQVLVKSVPQEMSGPSSSTDCMAPLYNACEGMDPKVRQVWISECLYLSTLAKEGGVEGLLSKCTLLRLESNTDTLDKFMRDVCEVADGESVRMATLHTLYLEWTAGNKVPYLSRAVFGKRLSTKGYKLATSNGSVLRGLRLKSHHVAL